MKLSAVQWRQHVESWRGSGLRQSVYCRQHGLNAKSFSRWIRKQSAQDNGCGLSAVVGTLDNDDIAQFIPIRLTGDNASGFVADRSRTGRALEKQVTAAAFTLRVHGSELALSTAVPPCWLAELLLCLS
jgi:hypothetical protein